MAPHHLLSTQWSVDLRRGWSADVQLRYVDPLPAIRVPAYTTADARVAWRLRDDLEVALVGRDLFPARHLEFDGGSIGNTEVEPSAYVRVVWGVR
jgi:hypothetical protein